MVMFLKKTSIRNQLLIFTFAFAVIVLLIILSSYLQIANIIRNNNIDYTKEMFLQIKKSFSAGYNLNNKILASIAYSNSVQNYILERDPVKRFELSKDIDNLIQNLQELDNSIIDIVILSNTGNSYFLKGKKTEMEKLMEDLPENAQVYYSGVTKLEYNTDKKDCFIVTAPIISIKGKLISHKIGRLAIVINVNAMGIIGENVSEKSAARILITDRNGNIFSSNGSSANSNGFIDNKMVEPYVHNKDGEMITYIKGKKVMVYTESLNEIGGKIISMVPESDLFLGLKESRRVTLGILFIAIIIFSIPFTIILNNILHPISKFMTFMSSIKSGNLKGLKNRISIEGNTEMTVMADEFNSMLDEIDRLTGRLVETNSQLYEADLEKKQAELAFLQSQINPHFLYNTLDAIRGIAAVKGVEEIREMTGNLSRIFRYSVRGEDFVQIKEELEIAEYYVRIQQIRFNGKFDALFDISPQLSQCYVPKMILQPIIENAIYHGLEPKHGKGRLSVKGIIDNNDDIAISITDDGVGMDGAILDDLCSRLSCISRTAKKKGRSANTRIGIINVNNRIKLTYGEQYGIEVNSYVGQGTCVTLKMPVRNDMHTQADR